MTYEAEICIRRSDPAVLAEDFQAVTALLARRKADRADSSSRRFGTASDRPPLRVIDGRRGT